MAVDKIPEDGSSLGAFYRDKMAPMSKEPMPAFNDIDRDLLRDIRTEFEQGNLTDNELRRMTKMVGDDDARAFLNKLASNPASSALKLELAQEGISLTDESDVGPGKRFETLEEKASYVGSRYEYTMNTIFPSIIAYGWGFVVPGEVSTQSYENQFNTPASRDALRVDVPVAHGGSSSANIGGAAMTVEQWLTLVEGLVGSVEFDPPKKSAPIPG